jgi:hypothetical protein
MRFLVAFLNKLSSSTVVQAIVGIALAKNKRLCAELLWMAHRDQKARNAWINFMKRHTVQQLEQLIRLDLSNTKRMKGIITKYSWPGTTLVGLAGCQAGWLLVQHADHDRTFQKQCLTLLEKAVENNEAPASLLAYLTDRIRVGDGQPQLFGTQLNSNHDPLPMEDETCVNELREKVGLPPLADYVNHVKHATANQLSLRDYIAEMKQLLSALPPSPEYDAYVAQMKHTLSTMNIV